MSILNFSPNCMLMFCRACKEIVGSMDARTVPFRIRCPKCGVKRKARFVKHWNGSTDHSRSSCGTPLIFLASIRSQAGKKMLDMRVTHA